MVIRLYLNLSLISLCQGEPTACERPRQGAAKQETYVLMLVTLVGSAEMLEAAV